MHRLAVLFAVAVFPWTILSANGYLTLYFAFGWVDLATLSVSPITTYVMHAGSTLPRYVTAYSVGVATFALALANATLGLFDREDRRVTAALLVLAGVSNAWFALGFGRRPGYLGVPIGTVVLWGVVWWQYRAAFRRFLLGRGSE